MWTIKRLAAEDARDDAKLAAFVADMNRDECRAMRTADAVACKHQLAPLTTVNIANDGSVWAVTQIMVVSRLPGQHPRPGLEREVREALAAVDAAGSDEGLIL